ncbi:predicted protein [Nematostella vectensis]|uniref:G-protein coupled receptors family 1 profile domain-containing protein n=1 Tax=Nematostella vectensis TaxID=45351 RepID=A7T6V5_NEMVE|nr:predicted protein [Nematostella vectensis]|eukprot:XP_001620399.1 hypothetical protein NEMVEDRAFT_v1g223159 [Nematostella vectensis]
MATERAFAVFVPFRQRSLNRRHYIIAITIIWVLAISIELPVILYKLNSIQMGRSKLNALENYLRVVFVSLAILTMAICYLAILLKRRFSQPVQGNEARIARDNARLTRTVVTVTILSLTCFIPIGCYFIYEASCIKCQYTSNMVQDLFLIFAYNNSFLNVVVYAYRMADFRQILREMFCKRLHTNPSRFLNIYGEPRINRNKNKCSTRSVKILDIAILDEGPENRKQKDDITMHSMTTVTGVENIGHANDATNVREI